MRLCASSPVGVTLLASTAQAQTDGQVEAYPYGGAEVGAATVDACDVMIDAREGPYLAGALNSRGSVRFVDRARC